MRLLVVNQFASTPKYSSGAGERHYFLAKNLKERNIRFTIISGSYNHLFFKLPETHGLFTSELIEGGEFMWVKQRKYEGKSFLGRFLSWFEFLFKLFFISINKHERPDAVIVSSMSIFPAFYAYYLKKRFNIPFILEIRDIWPLTPMQIGGYSKNHPFIRFMSWVEKFAYKHADSIITVLPSFNKHLINVLGYSKPIYWIPNGIDIQFESDSLGDDFHLPEDKLIFAYAGALGLANAMDCFVDAARILKANSEILFVILGDGPEKDNLQRKGVGMPNLLFLPKMKKTQVLSFLKNVDVCFISWQNLEMYNYGVSANKYNDYMLASKPIISASNIPDDPITMADCGLQVSSGNAQGIADAILKLKQMSLNERLQIGTNGYEYVVKNQTYAQIAEKFRLSIIETIENFRK